MPILKLGLVFFLIIFLTGKKCPLGYAVLIGSCILGIIFGMGGFSILKSAGKACIDLTTIELSAMVVLILILSYILEEKGQLRRILSSLQLLIRNAKVILVILPALIGLLPMPGGALFSAPMVKVASRKLELTPVRHACVNYWFRHMWEYVWPLYPGIILASKLSGISLPRLALAQLPLTMVMLMSGAFFYLRGIQHAGQGRLQPDEGGSPVRGVDITRHSGRVYFELLINALPILLVIILAFFVNIDLIIALAVSIVVAVVTNGIRVKEVPRLVFKGVPVNMVIMVLAIMVFKVVLRDCGSIEEVAIFLQTHHVPVVLIFGLLPFVAGFLTGLTVGSVGISFPIILALLETEGYGLSHIVLAFGMGFVGVLLSPVHLCLLVTKDYFKVQLDKVYRSLLIPVAPVAGMVIVLFLIY